MIMAKVKVRIFTLREFSDLREIDIHAENVSDALSTLFAKIGWRLREALCDRETGMIKPDHILLVNGLAIDVKRDLLKPLKDGDVIAIISPIEGGSS
jgi:molybdopterin converting factor small subunit